MLGEIRKPTPFKNTTGDLAIFMILQVLKIFKSQCICYEQLMIIDVMYSLS